MARRKFVDTWSLPVFSAPEQAAGHLRAEMLQGASSGTMPGVPTLVAELGVSHKTVKAALGMLEDEGLLVNQGRGVRRRIVLPEDHVPPALRVAVLFYEKGDEAHDLCTRFQNKLVAAGYTVVHGKDDIRQTRVDAEFVEGGTVGRVP